MIGLVLLALSAFIDVGSCQLNGGSDGVNGIQFFDGTANTDKINFGITCRQDTTSSTSKTIELYAYQADQAFDYDSVNPAHLANNLIIYSTCYLIDTTLFFNTKEVQMATTTAACDSSADFQLLATGVPANYQTRTMKKSITITPSDATYPCGAKKETNTIRIAFHCKRDINYDKAFDYVLIASHDVVAGTCLLNQVDSPNLVVKDPPVIDIKRNYITSFNAYKTDSITSLPDEHKSPDAKKITAPVDLGTAMYLEACLEIPGTTGTSPANNQFFDDGVAPIGMSLHDCHALPVTTGSAFTVDAAALDVTIVDAQGCGTQLNPVIYFSKTDHIFKWFRKSSDSVIAYLRSPNCFRTPPFEAVSFQRRISNSPVSMKFTCKVSYCTKSTETSCFGARDGATTSTGYPSCTTSGRKRRETITIGPDYPEELSVIIDVKLPGSNSTSSSFGGCFEKTTFIGLTSALTVLLLVVLAVGAYLAYKLRSPDYDDMPDSSSGSGSGKVTGSTNKAFF